MPARVKPVTTTAAGVVYPCPASGTWLPAPPCRAGQWAAAISGEAPGTGSGDVACVLAISAASGMFRGADCRVMLPEISAALDFPPSLSRRHQFGQPRSLHA